MISALRFKDNWVDRLENEEVEMAFNTASDPSVTMMGSFGFNGHLPLTYRPQGQDLLDVERAKLVGVPCSAPSPTTTFEAQKTTGPERWDNTNKHQ